MKTLFTLLATIAISLPMNAQTTSWSLGEHHFHIETVRGRSLLIYMSETTGEAQVLNLEPGVVVKDVKIADFHGRMLEVSTVTPLEQGPILFYLNSGGTWERIEMRKRVRTDHGYSTN